LNIFISGSTGFVGINLIQYLKESINPSIFPFTRDMFLKNSYPKLDGIVIHLAGKAHDLKGSSNNDEYQFVNFELTKRLFNAFLESEANVFITLSSVKAVADVLDGELTEEQIANPITHYGKSKLLAEQYILSKEIPEGKRVYILRPCMIHGPGNKGNLNLLYRLVSKNIPWPLGRFNNYRSFCSIDNLCFVVQELISRSEIESGIYNIADDQVVSTNRIIELIGVSLSRKPTILSVDKKVILFIAKVGDFIRLPLNSERLIKLTESYKVSNTKIKAAIGKDLPLSTEEGLLKTFKSFIK
jgi:nucleoside-diphosphate-sugar epimerase